MSWSVALQLGRVSNQPTVWTNVLAGIVLAGGSALSAHALILLVSMSLLYTAGMYLNDAFDREFDRRERPERPIPSGKVTAATVFAAGFAMILAGLALVGWTSLGTGAAAGWRAAVSAAVLSGVIVLYDCWHKGNPLSPLLMGLCRMLVYITVGLAVSATLPTAVLIAAAVSLSYLIGLTYIAKQETLRRVENLWPALFLAAPFVYAAPIATGSVFGAFYVLGFVAWVLYAVSFLLRPGRINVPRAVISLIAGISLLDGLFVIGHGQPALAGLAVAGFVATLLLQRYVAGT